MQAGWRTSRSDHALALGRGGSNQSAPASESNVVEHSRRTAGQRHPGWSSMGRQCRRRRSKPLAGIPDAHQLLRALSLINAGLLIFNLLPIYPLDGGQILHSLLWFVMGRATSLMAASVFGFF